MTKRVREGNLLIAAIGEEVLLKNKKEIIKYYWKIHFLFLENFKIFDMNEGSNYRTFANRNGKHGCFTKHKLFYCWFKFGIVKLKILIIFNDFVYIKKQQKRKLKKHLGISQQEQTLVFWLWLNTFEEDF